MRFNIPACCKGCPNALKPGLLCKLCKHWEEVEEYIDLDEYDYEVIE